MDHLSILQILGKAISDPQLINILLRVFHLLRTEKYKKIIASDPELDYLLDEISRRIGGGAA